MYVSLRIVKQNIIRKSNTKIYPKKFVCGEICQYHDPVCRIQCVTELWRDLTLHPQKIGQQFTGQFEKPHIL